MRGSGHRPWIPVNRWASSSGWQESRDEQTPCAGSSPATATAVAAAASKSPSTGASPRTATTAAATASRSPPAPTPSTSATPRQPTAPPSPSPPPPGRTSSTGRAEPVRRRSHDDNGHSGTGSGGSAATGLDVRAQAGLARHLPQRTARARRRRQDHRGPARAAGRAVRGVLRGGRPAGAGDGIGQLPQGQRLLPGGPGVVRQRPADQPGRRLPPAAAARAAAVHPPPGRRLRRRRHRRNLCSALRLAHRPGRHGGRRRRDDPAHSAGGRPHPVRHGRRGGGRRRAALFPDHRGVHAHPRLLPRQLPAQLADSRQPAGRRRDGRTVRGVRRDHREAAGGGGCGPGRGSADPALQAESAEDGTLDASEIRDQVLVFLLAGHETTATSLAFALHLLARHPEQQARARDEVVRVLDGRTPGPRISTHSRI